MSNPNLISEQWETFRAAVIPGDVAEPIVDMMRSAFYGGSRGCFVALCRNVDPGPEPTDKDLDLMNGIHEEIEAFAGGIIA